MKQRQEDWVKEQLSEQGYISRNQCLKAYISRLGAIIARLKKQGYVFKAGYVKHENGEDYIYEIIETPIKVNHFEAPSDTTVKQDRLFKTIITSV